MKISLVLEDAGSGPRVVYSSTSPEEARKFYKNYTAPGKLELVINPRPEYMRTIRMVEVPELKPVGKRGKEALL